MTTFLIVIVLVLLAIVLFLLFGNNNEKVMNIKNIITDKLNTLSGKKIQETSTEPVISKKETPNNESQTVKQATPPKPDEIDVEPVEKSDGTVHVSLGILDQIYKDESGNWKAKPIDLAFPINEVGRYINRPDTDITKYDYGNKSLPKYEIKLKPIGENVDSVSTNAYVLKYNEDVGALVVEVVSIAEKRLNSFWIEDRPINPMYVYENDGVREEEALELTDGVMFCLGNQWLRFRKKNIEVPGVVDYARQFSGDTIDRTKVKTKINSNTREVLNNIEKPTRSFEEASNPQNNVASVSYQSNSDEHGNRVVVFDD